MSDETYISVDVETTGPVPGLYSMIELGAVALSSSEGKSFSVCIQPADGELVAIDTLDWWLGDPIRAEQFKAIQAAAIPAEDAMAQFAHWLTRFRRPVLIGFPIVYDAMFINWYWWRYIRTAPPFSHSGLDIKTIAAQKLDIGYREASKNRIAELAPFCFRPDLPHTHRAVDDAAEQLYLYQQLLTIPRPPDRDLVCRCGHRYSQHSDKDLMCYECQCDFAQVS
jgi:DNA polymerase III epsilon subunit-like protein